MKRRAHGRRSNAAAIVGLRHGKERIVELLTPLFAPVSVVLARGIFGSQRFAWLRHLPRVPPRLFGWADPPVWRSHDDPTPEVLRSYAGTRIDHVEEQRAYEERPLHNFNQTHATSMMWALRHAWSWLLPTIPRTIQSVHDCRAAAGRAPARSARTSDPDELARLVRAEAARLGISAVGFTGADVRYTFAEFQDPGDATIVVCLLEQDWRVTQTAPSIRSERAAQRGYGQLYPKMAQLARFIQDLGFPARPNDLASLEGIGIHYGVQAGLGQLGLNGQLLTPQAGSRARLGLITTDAPIRHGAPRDFGIPKVCDACQLCVRRCPPGAIPKARRPKRGVTKASIKPERCFPTMAQTHGCAVCMKVCPIQRYGLKRVTDHYVETGTVLGKGTHALEGYVWPLDGRYYGPGEKPRINAQLLNPPGWEFDPTRWRPEDGDTSLV